MSTNGFQQTAYEKSSTLTHSSGDVDMASDAATNSFFSADYKKHDDLKEMLDSNKDNFKLEAMKRIISMVARGRDCSDLFPAVVKNVVTKDVEVKKLVYVYLTRYAEEQQDLALLSISTFQRALKDPNQLIRASALRVLSSIRVSVIVPIMMLAIKDAVSDMSPYVRKTAAHAIPKLYSLDPDQRDQLLEVIEKLLGDRTTLVAGSAIQAFEEVCPDRIDLIHKHYRKLCNLLVDVEEWGQVVIINMLTRYIRTQFIDPNKQESRDLQTQEKAFYSDDEEKKKCNQKEDSDKDEEEEEEESDDDESDEVYSDDSEATAARKKKRLAANEQKRRVNELKKGSPVSPSGQASGKTSGYVMDADHRLLLRNCRPLLNSRNSAVVMAVSQLYYHCAPSSELNLVAKAMIRLMRCNKEVQYIVLSNIASISISRRALFDPYLKSFYVHASDPTQVKLLKLEILTNLATETSISTILREFQTYVTSTDKEFVASTIQAIGRCAGNISEVTDTCLGGLVQLMSKKDEAVVAESVVVIRKLLQMQSSDHKDIIVHMARLVDDITVPMARASILWLIGEYCDRVPKIAPDVLRRLAKTFIQEEDIVKLQILNLAAKLCITNAKQSKLLTQYVLNLAKYDQNYDIRDRSRFLRALLFPTSSPSANGETPSSDGAMASSGASQSYLAKHAKKIFLATKPAPILQSKFKDHPQYQMGSLSHLLNHRATGYQDLPVWPSVAPDPSTRNVTPPPSPQGIFTSGRLSAESSSTSTPAGGKHTRKETFYSDDEEDEEEGSTEEESEEGEEGEGESEEESEEATGTETEESDEDTTPSKAKPSVAVASKPKVKSSRIKSFTSESEVVTSEVTSTSDEDDSSTETSGAEEPPIVTPVATNKKAPGKAAVSKKSVKSPPKANYDLLLDFNDDIPTNGGPAVPPLMPSSSSFSLLTPSQSCDVSTQPSTNHKPDTDSIDVYIPSQVVPHNLELVSKFSSGGCISAEYRFPRSLSSFSQKMVTVELVFTNHSRKPLRNIQILGAKLPPKMEFQSFPQIGSLEAGCSTTGLLSVDFLDSTQQATFHLSFQHSRDIPDDEEEVWDITKVDAVIKPPVGELLQPVNMTDNEFGKLQGKLTGMNESTGKSALTLPSATQDQIIKVVSTSVYAAANITAVSARSVSNTDGSQSKIRMRFAGRTVSEQVSCLIQLEASVNSFNESEQSIVIRVNCEKITIGSMVVKEIVGSLKTAL